jgi:tocopherol cyclase
MFNMNSIMHPAVFQGAGKKRRYFEGWYFKCVSEKADAVLAFIPGVALGNRPEESHSFIQIIDGLTRKSAYYKYPIESFEYSRNEFSVNIAGNRFSRHGLELHLAGGAIEAEGALVFRNAVPFPARGLFRGLMGPFLFVPAMQCYHDAVSLTQGLEGRLTVADRERDFTGGKGYVEKDWGHSFPNSWIWMQSNHFEDPGASFMLSLARVPWLGLSFAGFTGFLLTPERLFTFATYTGARLDALSREGDAVSLTVQDKTGTLAVRAERAGAGALQAPVEGRMDRRIAESLTGVIHLEFRSHRDGRLIFRGSGRNAGLEQVGDVDGLAPRPK